MKNLTKSRGLLESVDFSFSICSAKKENNGEDSFVYLIDDEYTVACVCDGCGGAGARKYAAFNSKTGAYLASRIVTGTIRDCAYEGLFVNNSEVVTDTLKTRINSNLLLVKTESETQKGLKGSLTKEFPTTLAAVLTRESNKNIIQVQCLWAGDSRCYLLCSSGLRQLTFDDLDIQDAMDNLTADGVMTNVISLSKDYCIHSRVFEIEKPFIVFAATDGCFSYYSTPMEYEYSIICCLLKADSARDWEELLKKEIALVSGDDYTMTGFAFGFEDLKKLQTAFAPRKNQLYAEYVRIMDKMTQEEKQNLWQKYKGQYAQYLQD